jgi:hypothetical protein
VDLSSKSTPFQIIPNLRLAVQSSLVQSKKITDLHVLWSQNESLLGTIDMVREFCAYPRINPYEAVDSIRFEAVRDRVMKTQ